MRYIMFSSIFLVFCFIGCGGSGGGGASGGSDTSSSGDTNQNLVTNTGRVSLGSRTVQDGIMSVSVERSVVPGASNSIVVTLSSGFPSQSLVHIACTSSDEVPSAGVEAVSLGSGRYRQNLVLPATLASNARIFVRLTGSDGSIIESGREDFLFTGAADVTGQ
jgi:hypothetical protein